MPHRAVVLAEETWISANALASWMDAGQEVAEVWCPPSSTLRRPLRQPLAFAFPRSSVRMVIRGRGIRMFDCPPLRGWPEAVARVDRLSADVLLNLLGLQIIPAALLEAFSGRALNVHPARLPRYRGPCPRLAMLVDGRSDEAGGVCLHVLTAQVDEGPIIAERRVPYPTAGGYAEWDAALADAAGDLIGHEAIAYLDGRLSATAQDESLACYRRPDPGTLDIGPTTPLAHAERLTSILGATGRLACRPTPGSTARAAYRVTAIDRVLGPPAGLSARVGLRTIELDIGDARVRLRRRGFAQRLRCEYEALSAMHRRMGTRRGSIP